MDESHPVSGVPPREVDEAPGDLQWVLRRLAHAAYDLAHPLPGLVDEVVVDHEESVQLRASEHGLPDDGAPEGGVGLGSGQDHPDVSLPRGDARVALLPVGVQDAPELLDERLPRRLGSRDGHQTPSLCQRDVPAPPPAAAVTPPLPLHDRDAVPRFVKMEISVTLRGGIPRVVNAGTFHYAYTVATHGGVSRARYGRLTYDALSGTLSVGRVSLCGNSTPFPEDCPVKKLVGLLQILLSPELEGTFVVEMGFDPDSHSEMSRWRGTSRTCPRLLGQSEYRIYTNGNEIGDQINSFGGSLAARQFAAVTRRFLSDPRVCVWHRVSKAGLVMANEIRVRRRLRRASRKRMYLTAEQQAFVKDLRRAVGKVRTRGEQCYTSVKLTQTLSMCLASGRVITDRPQKEIVHPDTLLMVCPKMSGWRRAFLSFVYGGYDPSLPGERMGSPGTLIICEDNYEIKKFMHECYARFQEFNEGDVRILSSKLPTRADLQCPLMLVTRDNLQTLHQLGRERKKEIRSLWCSPPTMASWQKVPDDASCKEVEDEELTHVAMCACEDILRGFPGETFPIEFVTWRAVLCVGRPENIRSKVFLRKEQALSGPVPARAFDSFLAMRAKKALTTSPVVSLPWMATELAVVLSRPKVSLSIRFAQAAFTELQTSAYDFLITHADEDLVPMELGIFDRTSLEKVLGYLFSPEELEQKVGENAKRAAQRLLEDAPYCDLCKMDDCDVVLGCGHWMCKECAKEAAASNGSCWRCDGPITLNDIFPVAETSGFPPDAERLLKTACDSPVLDYVCRQCEEHIRIDGAKTKASDSGVRICVVVDREAKAVVRYLTDRMRRARDVEILHMEHTNDKRNSARFVGGVPTVASSAHMVAVVDIRRDPLDPIPASNLVLLATPRLDRADLRRLRDSVGRVGCRSLVEMVCVSSSPQRRAPPAVEAFLRSGV